MAFRALGLFLAAVVLSLPALAADLVPYRVANGAIDKPLTDEPGNPARGRQVARDLSHATCLICHAMPIAEEPDHGGIGPSLVGVGSRYSEGELRLRLVNPKALNPETLMPSYYRVNDLYRVWTPYRDQPIYSAQQIEDVVAYLSQLKGN
jgi:sulfur-oxidizing protein SoxX